MNDAQKRTGIWLTMDGKTLANLYRESAAKLSEKAEKVESGKLRVESVLEEEDLTGGSTSYSNAVASMKTVLVDLRTRARRHLFVADHIKPDEVFVLSENDLVSASLI